jgi:hypothetical protein
MSVGRRTVSVSRAVFDRFRAECARLDVSCSGQLERLLVDLESGPLPRAKQAHETALWPERVIYPLKARAEAQILSRAPDKPVPIMLSRAVIEAVEDSLGDVRPGQGKLRDRPLELSAAFDAALVRMLDAYDATAERAHHCAVCRSRVRPFVPKLAGEGVVAVCGACMREERQLDGRRAS